MTRKRKSESTAIVEDSFKKSRFSEWLSDSDEESEPSEVEKTANNEASEEGSTSGGSDMDSDRHVSLQDFKSEQVSRMREPQPVDSTKSRSPLRKTSPDSEMSQELTPFASNFTELGVVPSLVSSLNAMSIRKPTAVQAACIPPLLRGLDCIGNAKTGSGKTVAFAVPILQKLIKDPYGIFALVLTPTRKESSPFR